ncbi:MAG: hypothetical protein J6Z38_05755 [Lachnospiraceae bacterium]|nr:hypothetical protein [Lachnospiraceae bacterium]
MKERIRDLSRFRKTILIIVTAVAVIFTALYARAAFEKGFRYLDGFLKRSEEGGSTVYSGRLEGKPSAFTVTPDGGNTTVTFTYGERTYGPYTVIEDPTAAPPSDDPQRPLTGYEIRQGEKVIFRGGTRYNETGHFRELYNEDGTPAGAAWIYTGGDVAYGPGHVPIDIIEPAAVNILDVAIGPELGHKGYWWVWFLGMVLCLFTAGYILFADEMFRFHMALRIRNAREAEPSELELAGRNIAWVAMTIAAVVVFWMGLR